MRHFRLNSITIELILLFVAAFAILEVVSLGYRSVSQAENLASLEAIRITDNIAVITSLIEKTPPEERSVAVRNFKGSGLYVSLDVEPWRRTESDQTSETRLLRSLLIKVMPQFASTDTLVGYRRSESSKPMQGDPELATSWKKAGPFPAPIDDIIDELATEPTLVVSVRLKNGTWLNFLAAYVESIDFWPLRSIVILSLAVIGTSVLSIWAIRRLTAPFGEFATAATRLGMDVNATPIEEHGPSDVRAAIQAFNGMQNKLRRFIEDRTQMLAAVSHDLRTPITRLRLRAECLQDRTQGAKFLEDLKEMEEMIAGILTFAKEDVLSEPAIPIDLIATLQSICDDFADRGFNVSFAGSGRLPYRCKRVSIRRCLTNLVENAVKYGQQAELSIDVSKTEIMIHIDDCGPGIPEKLREEAFRPFYRFEGSRSRDSGGTGLGLTVARNVARAHGGDVGLSGRAEGGLRATIVLPQTDVPFSSRPPRTGDNQQKLITGGRAGTQTGLP